MNREEKIEYIKNTDLIKTMWNKDEIENIPNLTEEELTEIITEIKEYYAE